MDEYEEIEIDNGDFVNDLLLIVNTADHHFRHLCPECGNLLIPSCGCWVCFLCGWSSCL